MLYLDNNATTRMCDEAANTFTKWLKVPVNLSANNSISNRARLRVDEIRNKMLTVAGCNSEEYHCIYTSGGSENNAFIITACVNAFAERVCRGKKALPHVITSSVEHKSILMHLEDLEARGLAAYTLVPPGDIGMLSKSIKRTTCLIMHMHANNETGQIYDIADIAEVAHENKIPFYTDATQSFAKLHGHDYSVYDAVGFSMHKLYGPQGLGVMLIRRAFVDGYRLSPLIYGTQQDKLRGGTENVGAIMASEQAMKFVLKNRTTKNDHLQKLRLLTLVLLKQIFTIHAWKGSTLNHGTPISIGDIVVISGTDTTRYMHGTLMISLVGVCNMKIKDALAAQNVAISTGSACNNNTAGASHVLHALDLPKSIRMGVIRISFGDYNTEEDTHKFVTIFKKVARELMRAK